MTRWLTPLFALLCLLLPLRAGAVAYAFPGNLPPGCSGSGGNYTCAGGTSLAYGDTVTINAPKPATITINGNFSTDTSQVNQSGNASDLTVIVNGTLTLGYQARIKANITANSINDAGGGGVVITGNLTANNNGNIALAHQTTVSGNVATSGSGTLTTPHQGSIGGNVTGGTGTITISEASTVGGSVTGSGTINVAQNATVSGNVSAGAGAMTLGFQSRVNGNLASTGAITTGQESRVGGNITAGAGNVAIGYGATVVGTLTTSSGSISFEQNAVASSCVRSTGSASITLGYQSNINSVCCGGSCTNSCVVNNSTYAMPALCAASTSLLADYRMDETTAWNGTAAEVKDASGNAHHGQAATASAGTPVATTASGSPAYGSTTSGSCGYGVFNRASPATTHAYVQLPNSFPSLTSNFTVLGWVRSSNPGLPTQRILANDDSNDGWGLSIGDSGGVRLRLYHRGLQRTGSVTTSGSNGSGATTGNCNSGGYLCLDSAAILSADTWYYVAALVDTTNKTVTTQIYDGAGTLLAGASTAYTGTWTAGTGRSSIGGESINSAEGTGAAHFSGNIDEVQVYSGLLNNSAITAQLARSRSCPLPAISSFAFSGTGSASTCSPQTLTITARDINGNTLTSYTGTVNLSTITGDGDWTAGTGPAPSGTLVAGAANSGLASYTFAAGDAGVVRLRLSHSLAQNVTVTAVDSVVASTSSTSAAVSYRDNAFVWSEDAGGLVSGTFVAVAGRNHDLRVSLFKKDPTTGNCSVATDYSGSRNLKLWRTDSGGTWTTPSVVSPALNPVPTARPVSNNLTLSFTAGIANFSLATTNIGKYAFNLDDDSQLYAATTVSGTSADLTVRPFTLAVTGLTASGINNPGGSTVADGVFAKAGAPFSASVTAYRWHAGADANNDGVPDANATLAQVSAGGAAAGFNSSVSLSAAAGSQTPATGVLGTLTNNVLSSFSSGTATTSNMTYSEVGSFQLNTSNVVGSYLGTAGLNLNALVFSASGAQQTRVGRFIPAGFALTSPTFNHRVDHSCSVASTFTYLDENFTLGFTLTARNATGGTTQNYVGSFALLDLATAAKYNLAGISGTTMFKTSNARLALTDVTHSGWVAGVASGIVLKARALRTTTPDGPFNASFGIAPVDADGVTMTTLDLDTDNPANGADRTLVGAIPLRFGRLRLQNGMAPANRPLRMAMEAQFWNGTAYNTNPLDSCSRISATNLSFGNLRRTLVASDAAMVGTAVTVASGKASLALAAPASGRVGSLDVAIALDTATDGSCLKDPPVSWTPAKAATTGAGLPSLRGLWCGASAFKDPGARATWGLYRGADGVLYQRENY
ncbi:DUF6701 domain-containing protein [Roseateles sp. LYH14W]|uniref:DUF6701 domain-containing protein n=1 Tax=Pelomonas parva TaxID=3299032 RepID=A0ABW7F4L2_9BURK